MAYAYETLTPQDQLQLATDRLRGLESDHYRFSIAILGTGGTVAEQQQLATYEAQIAAVEAEVQRVQGEIAAGDQYGTDAAEPVVADPAAPAGPAPASP